MYTIVSTEMSMNTPVKRWHTFKDRDTTLKKDRCSISKVTIALKQKVLKEYHKHKLRGRL